GHAAEIRNKSILRTWTKRAPAFIVVSPRRRSIAVERRQSLGAARPLLNRSFFRRVLRSKPKVYGLVRLTRNERLKMNRKREAVNKKALCAAGESRSHYGGICMWGRLPPDDDIHFAVTVQIGRQKIVGSMPLNGIFNR